MSNETPPAHELFALPREERERRIAQVRDRLRPAYDDPPPPAEECAILDELATLLVAQGDYEAAVDWRERAVVRSRAAFGLESAETATRLALLADAYLLQWRTGTAASFAEHARSILTAIRHEGYAPKASVLLTLASVAYQQGRYSDMVARQTEALAACEAASPEAPATNRVRAYLAWFRYLNGSRSATLAAAAGAALAGLEGALGPAHPWVADASELLGHLYRADARTAEAQAMAERAYAIRHGALGPDHPDTAIALTGRALSRFSARNFADAETDCRAALEGCERALGWDHPDTATAAGNLGVILLEQSRLDEAEPWLRRSLAAWEAAAPRHPETAANLANLAAYFRRRGDDDTAVRLFLRALDLTEATLQATHFRVGATAAHIADIFFRRGQFRAAAALYEWSLRVAELGDEGRYRQTEMTTRQINVGMSLRGEGRLPEAEDALRRGVALAESYFGEEDGLAALALFYLAAVCAAQGRPEEAEPLLRRCLSILEQLPEADPLGVATSAGELARLTEARGDLAETETLLRRALTLHEEKLDLSHPDAPEIAARLASVLERNGKPDEAREVRAMADLLREAAGVRDLPRD